MLTNCLAKCCVHLFINLFLFVHSRTVKRAAAHLRCREIAFVHNTHRGEVSKSMGFHAKRRQSKLFCFRIWSSMRSVRMLFTIIIEYIVPLRMPHKWHKRCTRKKNTKMPPLQLVSWALVHICRNLHKNGLIQAFIENVWSLIPFRLVT